jgi:hypothetical protein
MDLAPKLWQFGLENDHRAFFGFNYVPIFLGQILFIFFC